MACQLRCTRHLSITCKGFHPKQNAKRSSNHDYWISWHHVSEQFKRLEHVLSDKRQKVQSISLAALLSAHFITNDI
jgi:hypothetical protein